MLRIGLLTSGGDCQALNATMRGIVKTVLHNSKENVEIYGFEDGYQGLIYGRYRQMKWKDFSGVLTQGGTIQPHPLQDARRSGSRRSPEGPCHEEDVQEPQA